jgi:carbonic anhydrase
MKEVYMTSLFRRRLAFCLLVLPWLVAAAPILAHEAEGVPPAEARTCLEAGNARYAGSKVNPRRYRAERPQLAKGQAPYAMVLSCADSRVPPEIVFDESLGKLFVVRLAGNVADADALGSLEYAAEHLGTRYLLVLGHASCGAVKAAVTGAGGSPNLTGLVKEIQPAIATARGALPNAKDDELLSASVKENVKLQMKNVAERSPVLKEMIEKGKVGMAGGVYDLETGKVTFLPEK